MVVTVGESMASNDLLLVGYMDAWLERRGIEPAEPMRSLGANDLSFIGEVVPPVMVFVGVRVDDHKHPPYRDCRSTKATSSP